MAASTKWWLCGQCGFQNHPRGAMANSLGTVSAGSRHDNAKCEQCGAPNSDPDAVDYSPGSAVRSA